MFKKYCSCGSIRDAANAYAACVRRIDMREINETVSMRGDTTATSNAHSDANESL
jgi:hypothetical protein